MRRAIRLSRIELKGFRGVAQSLDLDLGQRLTIVYGGNAVGKSSLAQAIEFGLSGTVLTHEDEPIPNDLLKNTRSSGPGWIRLGFSNGAELEAGTDQRKAEVVANFRSIGAVDWPERDRLPVTLTHVTSQGMLSRVLGLGNPLDRNNLSSLCSGASLRLAINRSEKLFEHYRQASIGRNMAQQLRDAKTRIEASRLRFEASATMVPRAPTISESELESQLQQLRSSLGFDGSAELDLIRQEVISRLETARSRLGSLRALMARSEEIGEVEAETRELTARQSAIEEGVHKQSQNSERLNHELAEASENLRRATGARDLLKQQFSHLQEYRRLRAELENLREGFRETNRRAEETRTLENRLKSEFESVSVVLSSVAAARSESHNRLEGAQDRRARAGVLLQEVQTFVAGTPPFHKRTVSSRQLEYLQQEKSLEEQRVQLAQLLAAEAAAEHRLSIQAGVDEELIRAIHSLTQAASGPECPLCGHSYSSAVDLRNSIERTMAARKAGLEALRSELAGIGASRAKQEHAVAELASVHAAMLADLTQMQTVLSQREEREQELRSELSSALGLHLHELPLQVEVVAIEVERVDRTIEALRAEVASRTREASSLRERLSEAEHEIVSVSTTREALQSLLRTLTLELNQREDSLRQLGEPQEEQNLLDELRAAEASVADAELLLRECRSALQECEAERATLEIALSGAVRRHSILRASLASYDAELIALGADRDASRIAETEQSFLNDLEGHKAQLAKLDDLTTFQEELRAHRAHSATALELQSSELAFRALEVRQSALARRSDQFKSILSDLQNSQLRLADVVLQTVKEPVRQLFHSMTACCPWDLEFKLEQGKLKAVLSDAAGSEYAATSILNSAYINIAAIALRIALAGQQRWTDLRTIVMDDPILEMDNLTQSSLLDGLDALLTSNEAPWKDLQLVITTWSEDFALMAAHKLAHLNVATDERVGGGGDHPNFVVYRLALEPNGNVSSKKYSPRWSREVNAA